MAFSDRVSQLNTKEYRKHCIFCEISLRSSKEAILSGTFLDAYREKLRHYGKWMF